jgi:hypothetical protein
MKKLLSFIALILLLMNYSCDSQRNKLVSDWNLASMSVNISESMSSVELKNVNGLNKTLTTLSIKENGVFTFTSQSKGAHKKYLDIYLPFYNACGVWQKEGNILSLKFSPEAKVNPNEVINEGFEITTNSVVLEYEILDERSIDRLSLNLKSSSWSIEGLTPLQIKYLTESQMNFVSYDFEQLF